MNRTFRITKRGVALFETSDDEAHEYATTQAVPPDDISELVKAAQEAIDQGDLHADGFGPPPHITVLYGISDEDKDTALEVMRNHGPCRARVRGVDLFQNDDQDVVIFAVESDDLTRLRDELDKAIPDNANTWPEYKPHMTIAYVAPGAGEKYKDIESDLIGREFDLDALEFSGTQDDDVERVELGGAVNEESPLFGTDILAGDDPGTEDTVKKALHPVINRSNRRIVSVSEDDEGTSVLLDNGMNLMLNRGQDESWVASYLDEQYKLNDLAAVESLVNKLSSSTTEGWHLYEQDPEADPPTPDPTADAPPDVDPSADPPDPNFFVKPHTSRTYVIDGDPQALVDIWELVKDRRSQYRRFGNFWPVGGDIDEGIIFEPNVERFRDVATPMRRVVNMLDAVDGLVAGKAKHHPERYKRPKKAPKPAAPPAPTTTAGDVPPQVDRKAIIHNDGYKIIVTLDVPPTERHRRVDPSGKTIEEIDDIAAAIKSVVGMVSDVRKASTDTVTVEPNKENQSPRTFSNIVGRVKNAVQFRGGQYYDVETKTTAPKRTWGQWLRGIESVDEDTFSSDVGFTDTIPITKVRRRKVNLPGLTKAGKKRRVKRRYEVKESMSREKNPILIVLRPQQVQALGDKPVWSALSESGVIVSKPFKMGTEDFFEVSIDTLRKEWTQANAGVLLDEVGSIDPRIQRQVMEGVDAERLAKAVQYRIKDWCEDIPIDVAKRVSESFVEAHRRCRLRGGEPSEKGLKEMLRRDVGVVRSVFEWYGLSREVLERLKDITGGQYDDYHQINAVKQASKAILEVEATDPAAGIGGAGAGMPTANAGAATIQGYSEQEPEGVSMSSRNWPAQSMFKLHVLVGDVPQWAYRQVVGHEGEGEQSMLVYRTPEGRVMRMPHEEIDAAEGFGAVVTPDELQGTEPGGEEPVPTFEPSPEGSSETPPIPPMPATEQAAGPEQDKLSRDAAFSKALAQYQQSKDEKDWDEVRKQAERATGKSGPDVDKLLAPFASNGGGERQPMMGGAYEEIMPPIIDEEEDEELDEKETRQMKGRKIKEPTHMKALASKAGVGMDRAMKAWGEAQFDFEKAHPDVKKKSDRYYKGVTGYMKKKIGLDKNKKESADDERQAAAVKMFMQDDDFHAMLNKFESTRNDGYLIRACERASRVAGIPVNEARALVEEILEASKQNA